MLPIFRRVSLLVACLLALSASPPVRGSSITISYLQQISDKCQKTVDVYTDADSACNHFAARGEFDNLQANRVAAMDEISKAVPCFDGITCITATFDPGTALFGGWYFLNGFLGSTDRQPPANWGDHPNAGYDLTGATTLQFWARGAVGGEVVHFFAFGVGNTAPPFQPYPDSSPKVELPQGPVTLSTTWTRYQIPLAGLDLHYVLGGFGWVANAIEGNRLQPRITFYLDDIQFVKARPDDPRFLVSYETIKSTDPFDVVLRNAAYVYDNSVSLIALIASGDLARARTIADALVYAQGHDRFFTDGRIRNAYQGGDISLPPGWLPNNLANTVRMPGRYDAGHQTWFEDPTQVSTNTGNVAWAGLALLNMWEVTKDPKYLTAAEALGNWVLANTSEKRGGTAGILGGFTGGYDGWENGAVSGSSANCASGVLVNGQCKRLYKSTEHTIDLYSMFSRLYLADGKSQWADAAQQAKHFFLSMWDPQGGKFWTGTTEDGATISPDVIPLDIQAWAIQTLGSEAQAYLQGLDYVEAHHKTSLGYGFKQNGGNACGDHTWFEGTSQVAVAYLLSGKKTKWQSILDGVHSVQTATGGIPATDGECLNTGFTLNDGSPWEYFPRVHVGATGWLDLAENGVNPYRAELYSPALSTSGFDFGDQSVGTQGSARTVTFSNPGVGPLSIRGVALTGANASDFQQSNTCGTSLPSGATCTITLSFTPGATGVRNAALTITESSDPAMTPTQFSVSVSGNGIASPTSFILTLNAIPQVGGTIVATPTAPSGAYLAGAKVCLAAVPATGWSFAAWSGDVLDASSCIIMSANRSVTATFTGAPVIRLTSIPQYGSLNGSITGTVTGVPASNYQIAALVFLSGQGWFSKPYCTSPSTPLGSDGSFSILLTTGGVDQFATRIALLIVPSSLTVSCYTAIGGIPTELLQQSAAQIIINRPNPGEREIGFSQQQWAVKASTVPVGPGNCVFSDSPENVFVDAQGYLHLKIINKNGNWSCAEVYSRVAVGYGVYQWTIASSPALDPSGVFGSFTWADAELNARELDVEFGFNKPGDPTNAQFVLQPFSQPGNLQRISIPTSSPITFKMTWLPDTLLFQAFVGVDDRGNKIQEWRYASAPPPADSQYENFRFNLWLNGAPPSSGQPQEVIVNSFQYQPFAADPNSPAVDGLVSDASFLPGTAPGMDFALFGQGFSAQPATAPPPPLPLTLGGTTVTVNGIPAPLFYVNSNQVNGQIPYIAPLGPSLVGVSANGRTSRMRAFVNAAAAPGIFVGPSQSCLAQNQNQTLNSQSNPAAVGSIITAYLTGLGQVDNPVATGSVAPATPLSRALLAATAKIDGQSAVMDFLGLVPGLVGVGQANIHVPTSVSGGLRSLTVAIGGVVSNSCSLSIAGGVVTSPVVVSIGPTSGLQAGGTMVTVNGSNFATGATVKFGANAATVVTVTSANTIQATTPAGAAVGTVDVTVTNPTGESGSLPNGFRYLGPAPVITSMSPTSGPIAGGTVVTFTGSNFVTGATVSFNGPAATNVTVVNSSTTQATSPAGQAGSSVRPFVTNPDGQVANSPTMFSYVSTIPVITYLIPTSGPLAGGTVVSVNGSNFVAGATVKFGSATATAVSVTNANSIQATTPAGNAVGNVNVTVTNPSGDSGSLPNGFKYLGPAPVITSMSPISGPTTGGTVVTFTGSNFVSGATVSFNGPAATNVTVVNANTIQATSPPGQANSSVRPFVTNPDGQVANSPTMFSYVSTVPVITYLIPTSGPLAGGTVVSVNGSNFVAGATVKFGSATATAVSVTNANSIQATTPAGAAIGTVDVTVTNPTGESGSLPNGFRYLGPGPVITSMSPISGPTTGGTVVTFTGSNFVSGATVSFNGPAATNVTVVNANTIQATSPPGQANSSVRPFVTNPDGQVANSPTMFSYVSTVPVITYLIPSSGPLAGGTVVSVNGSNFVAGATVKFGSATATAVSVTNANSIQATTPAGNAVGNVNVTVTNPSGDSGSLPNGFKYLGPAPVITSMGPISGPTAGGTVVTFSGSNFVSGATVSFNGPAATNVTVVNANTIQATSPPGQANSSVRPFVTNPDGQVANSPTMFSYVSTVPVITYLIPTSGPLAGGTAVTINGSNFAAGATVKFGAIAATAVNVTSANTIQATTPAGAAVGTVDVTVTNPTGESGSLPNGFRYLGPGPVITSMSPISGPTTGGTVVTFTGSNFVSGATVSFNGPAATNVTVVNANTIQATSPPGQANSSVRPFVTNPDGQVANSPTMFSYVSTVPVITYLIPSSGPLAGGTVVSVNGSNFVAGATVKFGSATATAVSVTNANSIQATAPAGSTVGSVNVTVTNPSGDSGSLPNGFKYLGPAPVITSMSPISGPTAGGTVVTFSGSNFVSGATVSFNGPAATNVTVVNANTIQATSPPGQANSSVRPFVTNPDGQVANSPTMFSYVSTVPVITYLLPISGPQAGGTVVTINGSNFASGATVKFGATAATAATVTSANTIQATTPAGTGTVSVIVVNPDGQSGTLPNSFSYQSVTSPTIHASVQAGKISGTVTGVNPPQNFKVAAYVFTNFYYIQPCVTESLTAIASNGTWGPIDSHNGTIFALLVNASYSPPSVTTSLPPVDGVNVLAVTGPSGTVSGYDVARCPAQ